MWGNQRNIIRNHLGGKNHHWKIFSSLMRVLQWHNWTGITLLVLGKFFFQMDYNHRNYWGRALSSQQTHTAQSAFPHLSPQKWRLDRSTASCQAYFLLWSRSFVGANLSQLKCYTVSKRLCLLKIGQSRASMVLRRHKASELPTHTEHEYGKTLRGVQKQNQLSQ